MATAFVSFAEVKARVGFETLLDRYGLIQGLTRKGDSLAGPCPVCGAGGKRPFTVNLTKNAWYCFGKCRAGGNVLDFVAKKEGVEIRRAAELLNRWFDLDLERTPMTAAPEASKAPRVTAAVALPDANPVLSFALKQIDPEHPAFAAYGLSLATARAFESGYCGKGLLKGRLAIPVRNFTGELVAYVGLHPDPAAKDRYQFPPSFFPELEVFNLDRALLAERGDRPLFLTGQVVDVLTLSEYGFPWTLGLFTAELSGEQESLLLRSFAEGTAITLLARREELHPLAARLARHFAVRIRGLEESPIFLRTARI